MAKQVPLVFELNNSDKYQPLLRLEQTCGMKSGRVFLAPGADCGEHSTGTREEQLVFLAGSGKAEIAGEVFEVGVGKVCYIPLQTLHNIKNDGDEPLIYIYCVAPVYKDNNQ